jgi:RND superfamily putative drug exporter
MFFRFLGHVVRRGWPFLLLGWVVIAFVTEHFAPPWDQVAQDKEFDFLPENLPSRQAEAIYAKAFPEDRTASNLVLVLSRETEGAQTHQQDLDFIENTLEPGLRRIAEARGGLAGQAAPSNEPLFFTGDSEETPEPPATPKRRSIIARILTPDSPSGGPFLVSPDGRALLVVLELTTEFMSRTNWPTITAVQDLVHDLRDRGQVPERLDVTLTGSAVIGRDHTQAQLESVRATQSLTVLLVIVLLLLIYRAPFLALIPLVTVYLAVRVAINLLSILAAAGHLTLFEGIQIYVTILAYGAGVDYCLFLTARCREELERGKRPAEAVAAAVGDVGAALTASAAAVICGIAMMCFARFGKFSEAGMAIPFSLGIVLCATLTFSTSLLCLAGPLAFWPMRPDVKPAGGAEAAGKPAPAARPGWRSLRDGWLENAWDHVGRWLLRRPGTIWLSAVALMAPFVTLSAIWYSRLSYDLIGVLPSNSTSVEGTRVLEQHFPRGMMGPATVLLVNPAIDFTSDAGRQNIGRVTDALRARQQELDLADVRSLTAAMGITAASKVNPFAGMNLPEATEREAQRRGALEHYVTDLGGRKKEGTRLELVLNPSPFSRRGIEYLDRTERVVRETVPAGTRVYVTGTTASIRDLATVIREDRGRVELLVLVSVFVILTMLLRCVLLPAYLLLSVLFSYFATLGVTFLVFWALDPHGFVGIDWNVAIFLFTILIAVGADYNIFLITRVREEELRHGPVLGITQALERTGPIISSCGIIMAGTFASLLAGTLYDMRQLGFALAFGVLLDTFVVRPVLVPGFLILWRTGQLKLPPWPALRCGGPKTLDPRPRGA